MKNDMSIQDYEALNPHMEVTADGKKMIFNTPNAQTAWRASSLFEKEPDTIAWLESFQPDAVFYDIGANVGMYSVYSASVRGVQVFAFEPESQNFALLNKNIFSNNLTGSIKAFPVALSDATAFDSLFLSGFMSGGSCHNFGESVDFNDRPFQSTFEQGCFAIPLDRLIADFGFPMPDYIKVDVDGLEHKVISGAMNTIRSGVRSVLVEVNTLRNDHLQLVEKMEQLGFSWSQEQVNQFIRKSGPFEGTGNYIFYRD